METNVEFSIVHGLKKTTTHKCSSLKELAEYASKRNVSCGIFKDGSRTIENFLKAETIALDIDDGIKLEDARELFKPFKHVIMTTRNHQKNKGGVTADRFRVILSLAKPITNADDYYATWYSLYDRFPFIDKACKDPSRMFYPSPKVDTYQDTGGDVTPVKAEPKKEVDLDTVLQTEGERGKLSRATLEFLQLGIGPGLRHEAILKASTDAREQGYSIEEFTGMVQDMINRTGNWGTDYVNNSDIQSIKWAWSKDPRHAPRVSEQEEFVFEFKKLSDLAKDNSTVEWIVDDLLTRGGLSLIAGAPKSGKSTITRQLALAVSRGGQFLGRKVKKGRVLYLALEEQPEMLVTQFKKHGLTDEDDVLIHVGTVFSKERFKQLENFIKETEPTLVVVDTMALFSQFENMNNYDEVNMALTNYRTIARKSGTHIVLIHHQNKGENRGTMSIMGSGAIHGAVDNAIIFNKYGTVRKISTSQRGGRGFDNHPLIFDIDTEHYTLGEKASEEF